MSAVVMAVWIAPARTGWLRGPAVDGGGDDQADRDDDRERDEPEGVARRLVAGDVESPVMPLDETISIMETMDTVQAQARQSA